MRRIALAAALLLLAGDLQAHDFWIEPSTFHPLPGATVAVGLRVGQNFVGDPVPRFSRGRSQQFFVRQDGADQPIEGSDGIDPAGFLRADGQATALIAYRSTGSYIELPPGQFEDYLRLYGLERIIGLRTTRGERAKPGREHFFRYAKALLTGRQTSAAVTKPLGFAYEIVPDDDPTARLGAVPRACPVRRQTARGRAGRGDAAQRSGRAAAGAQRCAGRVFVRAAARRRVADQVGAHGPGVAISPAPIGRACGHRSPSKRPRRGHDPILARWRRVAADTPPARKRMRSAPRRFNSSCITTTPGRPKSPPGRKRSPTSLRWKPDSRAAAISMPIRCAPRSRRWLRCSPIISTCVSTAPASPVNVSVSQLVLPPDITLPSYVVLKAGGPIPEHAQAVTWRYGLVYSTYAVVFADEAGGSPVTAMARWRRHEPAVPDCRQCPAGDPHGDRRAISAARLPAHRTGRPRPHPVRARNISADHEAETDPGASHRIHLGAFADARA